MPPVLVTVGASGIKFSPFASSILRALAKLIFASAVKLFNGCQRTEMSAPYLLVLPPGSTIPSSPTYTNYCSRNKCHAAALSSKLLNGFQIKPRSEP